MMEDVDGLGFEISTEFGSSEHGGSILTDRSSLTNPSLLLNNESELRSEMHRNLLGALAAADPPLQHFNVINESYWFNMRRKLGARKHSSITIKQNTAMLWEGFIYKIKRRDVDLELVATKVSVGSFKTKWLAYRACEVACKQRDENPALKMGTLMEGAHKERERAKVLSSHFRILAVSDRFQHHTYTERVGLVYEILLNSMGVSCEPPPYAELGRCSPIRMKMTSHFGKSVCALPIFRFLLPSNLSGPLTLIVECKTPSQWRPELYVVPISERLGSTHLSLSASHIPVATRPKAQKQRLKKLATTFSTSSNSALPPVVPKNASDYFTDSLGLDASISGVKYKKLGGIYGHFFNDLSEDVKQMVLSKYKDNKHLIQMEGSMPPSHLHESSSSASKAVSGLRSRVSQAAHLSYDAGTSNESEMIEQVNISNRKMERIALTLQRIRRCHVTRKAVKRLWWRKFSAITIQRFIRGCFGRQYCALFRRLRPVAARLIQEKYRDYRYFKIKKVWVFLSNRLTRFVLPKIKRFIRNCFLSWIYKREQMVLIIQNFFHIIKAKRLLYFKKGWVNYPTMFYNAAVAIQKIMRAFLARRFYELKFKEFLFRRIDIPAAIRIQRVFQGRKGRTIAARKKLEKEMCIRIQIFGRKYIKKVWALEMFIARLRKRMSIRIQRLVRGIIGREIVRFKKHDIWYKTRFIPAILKTQAVSRGYQARKVVAAHKIAYRAAKVIQKVFRGYCSTKKAREYVRVLRESRRFLQMAKIQAWVRRFLTYRAYRRRVLERNGQVIKAARIIMRAWLNFRLSQRYTTLIDSHKILLLQRKIEKYASVRKDLLLDIEDIHVDIHRAEKVSVRLKRRCQEMEIFQQQSAVRLTHVKEEMAQLTPDDFEKGWAEALVAEFEYLSHQQLMSREELRLVRAKVLTAKREIQGLIFELEESEYEVDRIEVLEVEAVEAKRRTEVGKIHRRVTRRMQREIRRERSHWRIDSVRKNVITKLRPRYHEIVNKARSERTMEYFSSVNFENRQKVRDYEELSTNFSLENEAMKRDRDARPATFEDYAGPVQQTYDTVVQSALDLLRGFTLNNSAAKLRKNADTAEMNLKMAKKGQFWALKAELQQEKS